MVLELPFIFDEKKICEGCILGKMHRLSFPKQSWRASAPLQSVHDDIWCPYRNPTFAGKRYFLLFVDDYTRMIWVYFIENKYDAFTHFIEFKAFVEKVFSQNIKNRSWRRIQ